MPSFSCWSTYSGASGARPSDAADADGAPPLDDPASTLGNTHLGASLGTSASSPALGASASRGALLRHSMPSAERGTLGGVATWQPLGSRGGRARRLHALKDG